MSYTHLSLHRLIAKIDNDFNIDNSDWIPRVGAWVIDALSQIKCLPKEKKRRRYEVNDRIAISLCDFDTNGIKVYDSNGNEIPEANTASGCGCQISSTGGMQIGLTVNSKDSTSNTVVVDVVNPVGRNYVISGGNKIELNFDTDYIEIESNEVVTYHDDYYDTEVPYIYDNGLLLEALAWYCLFKMLSRGYKHQVYSITSQNQTTNPYIQWNNLKDKAAASVKNDIRKNRDEGWNNFFYNSTFLPRSL